MTKICKKCGVDKPVDDFRVFRGYVRGECRVCEREITRKSYTRNPEKHCAASRKWRRDYREQHNASKLARYHKNPGKHNAKRRNWKYGLADGQYESILLSQGGGCAICGGKYRLSVDHCHDDGSVRGILCAKCNSALGFLDDSFPRVVNAASYLRKFSSSFRS